MHTPTESPSFLEEKLLRLKNLSTPLISDAMDRIGIKNQIITGLPALTQGMRICGKAFTAVYADHNDPAPSLFEHNRYLLEKIPENQAAVLLLENRGVENQASSWGYLVSLYAKNRGIQGLVTNGLVRDTDDIRKLEFPVFAQGFHATNSNQFYKVIALQQDIQLVNVTIHPSDYILGDDSGLAIIPPAILDIVLTLAEKKKAEENLIAELMNKGYTLREIDKVIKERSRFCLFSEKNNWHLINENQSLDFPQARL